MKMTRWTRIVRTRNVLAIAGISLLVLGCGGGDASDAGQPQAARGGNPFGRRGGAVSGPVPVETDTVRVGRIARVVTVPGTVSPIRSIGVNAQMAVTALEVRVEEGDRVEKGEILAVLDDREISAQYRAAAASFEVSDAAYERARQLIDRQVITQAEFDASRTAYEAARAQLDQLSARVGYARVRAPIGGVVTEKMVEAGDVVGNQTRLFTLAEVDTMVVRVQLSELDVVEVMPGDRVEILLDAWPGRVLHGTVRRVFPMADPATRLVPVEVVFDEKDKTLPRQGFLARTSFELDPRENTLLIPTSALVARRGSQAVFLVVDSTAILRSVVTGLTAEGDIEIVQGLAAGDRVVTAGGNLLRDGAIIRDVGRERAAAADSAAAAETLAGNSLPRGGGDR